MDRLHSVFIEPKNGAIQIENFSFLIAKDTPIDSVKRTFQVLMYAEDDMRTGYVWINLKSLTFGGQPAYLSLCFLHKKLEMITFAVTLPSDELDSNWPTEATSHRHVEFMRKELEKQLFCKLDEQKFSWGSVWSNFDGKGFRASAGIQYK